MENPKYLVIVRYTEVEEHELFESLEDVVKFMNDNGSFNLDFTVYEVGAKVTYYFSEVRIPQPPRQVETFKCIKEVVTKPTPDKVTRTYSIG